MILRDPVFLDMNLGVHGFYLNLIVVEVGTVPKLFEFIECFRTESKLPRNN